MMSDISPFSDWASIVVASWATDYLEKQPRGYPKTEWVDLIYPKNSNALLLFLSKPLKVLYLGRSK